MVCAGYKGYLLKEYFANLGAARLGRDLRPRARATVTYHQPAQLPWRVTVVGHRPRHDDRRARAARARVPRRRTSRSASRTATASADVDVAATIELHRRMGSLATMTVVRPLGPLRHGPVDGDAGHGDAREAPVGVAADQRRLLRRRAGRARPRRGRPDDLGERRPARGSPRDGELAAYRARRLLAAHGHGVGARAARGARGSPASAPWKIW